MNATRYQIIPRPLGGASSEHGGFNFQELTFVEIVTCRFGQLMTQNQRLLNCGAAQVDKAIFQPQLFIGKIRLGRKERRGLAFIQDIQLAAFHVNLTRSQLQILHIGRPSRHFTSDRNHILVSQRARNRMHFRIGRAENDLCHAVAISEIDKDESSKVAIGINPPT